MVAVIYYLSGMFLLLLVGILVLKFQPEDATDTDLKILVFSSIFSWAGVVVFVLTVSTMFAGEKLIKWLNKNKSKG